VPGVAMLDEGDIVTLSNSPALTGTAMAIVMRIAGQLQKSRDKVKFSMDVDALDNTNQYESASYYIVGTDALNGGKVAYY
jgi:hypothetical protein